VTFVLSRTTVFCILFVVACAKRMGE